MRLTLQCFHHTATFGPVVMDKRQSEHYVTYCLLRYKVALQNIVG